MAQTQKRRSSTPRPRAAADLGVAGELAAIRREQDAARRMQQFDFLGRAVAIITASGGMQFDKNGPGIAILRGTRQVIFVSDWPGLPDIRTLADKPCPACAVPCDECTDGMRPCQLAGCGGTGVNAIKRQVCAACKGRPGETWCETCGNVGSVATGDKCAGCGGTGKMKCGLCFGTGKMGTGVVGIAGRKPQWDDSTCPECKGQKREFTAIAQPLEPMIAAVTEGLIWLTQAARIILHIDGDSDTVRALRAKAARSPGGAAGNSSDAGLVPLDIKPDASGHQLVIMLEDIAPGSKVYTAGGLADL